MYCFQYHSDCYPSVYTSQETHVVPSSADLFGNFADGRCGEQIFATFKHVHAALCFALLHHITLHHGITITASPPSHKSITVTVSLSHCRQSTMPLTESSTRRDAYEQCFSYKELLNHTSLVVVARLTNSIRNWKRRHALSTLDEAFEQHRQHTLHPCPAAPLAKRARHARISADATIKTSVASASPSSLSLSSPPSSAPLSSYNPVSSAPSSPALAGLSSSAPSSSSFSSSSPSEDELRVHLQATVQRLDVLARDISTLRSQLQQRNTPSLLVFNLIAAKFKQYVKVLSIVGDGRCLLYSLLQSVSSLLPSPREADQLRAQLRAHLLSSYSAVEWERRVPSQLSEGSTPPAFANRYLTGATTHLPPDAICIWQDLLAPSTDVYLLQLSTFETKREEHVEKLPCRGTAVHAMVLLLTWHGVGHYELVTFNDVIPLPCSHAFIQHLDQLHQQYMSGFSKAVKRAERKQRGEKHTQQQEDVVE